ncbi:hypothetical protein OEG86_09120 [Hoeflea alexandrii]|uniref:hypothetical protein n=1 Tax=Hoeflea alexandrii TaxID=288436 RepID=UPI00226E3293|nr:hypothetical protein [Hoeflea alexandrii]MCY0152362.1 hypothetical protein [Hoeflea alexandrii]
MIKPDADTAPKPRLGETFNRRRLGKKLLRSELVQSAGSALIGWTLSAIWRSNRDNGTSTDWETLLQGEWLSDLCALARPAFAGSLCKPF